MTIPPPPQGPQGPWPAQQPPPGQPPTPPPGYPMPPQQYGPPPGQYPGWPPAGPPKKSNGLKWVLAGVALIAVIAVAVAITAVVLRSDSGSGGKGGSGSTSDVASANDTGPVGIIAIEPTCDQFIQVNNALAGQEQNGWTERDPSVPATLWSPDLAQQYKEVGAALLDAADRFMALAKQTPHRVVRELYEQSIAYKQAYIASISNYVEVNNNLIRSAASADNTLLSICQSITSGSAASRVLLAPKPPAPLRAAPVGSMSTPKRFVAGASPICDNWIRDASQYDSDLTDWRAMDSAIPASEWTSDQRSVNDAAAETMRSSAQNAAGLAAQTDNPIMQDFLALTAQYRYTYAEALPTYVSADGYLYNTSSGASTLIASACQATAS